MLLGIVIWSRRVVLNGTIVRDGYKKERFNFERTLYYIMIVVVNKSFISDR